ncbi:Ferric uptake regulation protein [Planctomycetes bacterium Pan216]|uniref:Ferric uptake regulation protein n=1 Tax=Kolteria novifilia TaxID=2527975 RepID=A0A518B3Q4_9BACT|nr:Ferric uptake regulation protein [Planctomycetes bacterium Pan216]
MSTSTPNLDPEDAKQIFDGTVDLPSVPVSQSPVEKFREYLDLHGLKCTGERMRLVEHVFEEHNHFEADQLVARVRERSLRVSRSTVYRTLTLLVEAGLLRELKLGSRTAYEHDYGYPQHEHLFCEKCGKVLEFVSEEISQLVDEICRKFQFRPSKHQFVVHGICQDCRNERSPRRRLDLI